MSPTAAASNGFRRFRPSWRAFLPYFLGMLVFLAGPRYNPATPISPALGDLLATLCLAFILVKRFTNLYEVDGQRVVWRRSFPRAEVVSLPIAGIERVDLRRGLVHRLGGVAHVHLYRRGEESPAIRLFGVPNPEGFQARLWALGAGGRRVTGAWRR